MNWKSARKATYIFGGIVAGVSLIGVTAPWSFLAILVGLMWWLIYDLIENPL
jgi:hypothetical protein